jgi:phage-related protein
MTIPTFAPPVSPSAGAQDKPEIKILKADFGDGYSQPIPDGINNIRSVMTIAFEGLERDERDQILSFLVERKGTQPFLYTLPGEAQPIRFTCADWSNVALGADLYTINATFRQDFNNTP